MPPSGPLDRAPTAVAGRPFLAPTACLLIAVACSASGSSAISPATRTQPQPQWQDVLPRQAPLLVMLRPKALRRDAVYGPLLGSVLELASERSRVASSTRILEAIEDADQVFVDFSGAIGTARDEGYGGGERQELTVVVLGVRADIDPARLVDADGNVLWAPGPSFSVRELTHELDPDGVPNQASLFELPGRTWVIVSGGLRARAREAFARPLSRPLPRIDADVLAMLRIDGPSLVRRVELLRGDTALAPIGRGLQLLTLELVARESQAEMDAQAGAPDHAFARARLTYADPQHAAASEGTLRDVARVIDKTRPQALAWIDGLTVERTVNDVRLTARLAPSLATSLAHTHLTTAPMSTDAGAPGR